MSTDGSAYATLGLEPGADSAAIERAYKRLIKQFHPDRSGGDAKRAAEINRAYRELQSRAKDALEFEAYERAGGGFNWARAVPWVIIAILAALLVNWPSSDVSQRPAAPAEATQPSSTVAMDEPLARAEIDGAIARAVQLASRADELAMAEASRDCFRALHSRPSLARLDGCAAFDDAVAQLQDRDPLRDRGPFSELAVTGRQMSGATLLSNDYLAIDSRLDRIRLQVELALAPAEPPAASSIVGTGQ